jgi:superfamily II DNA/RNA helicase
MQEEQLTFEDFNIDKNILTNIYLNGFKNPTKFQINGIQKINTGKDCIIQSQSGTGKTITYLLGTIPRLLKNKSKGIGEIIILPTRELAEQVYNIIVSKIICNNINIVVNLCIGGINLTKNIYESDIIIATVGKLYYFIDKTINYKGNTRYVDIFNNLKFIILDEVDNLLDNKDLEDIILKLNRLNSINSGTRGESGSPNYQTILISATISDNVFHFCNRYMKKDSEKVLLNLENTMSDLIKQFYFEIENESDKFDSMLDIYNIVKTSQAIIFVNTIEKIKWIENEMNKNNFSIIFIHSDMSQEERLDIISKFRSGVIRILLTSDLLSRGIDIPQVNLVINYDLPNNFNTYIHRIGRCGRFDRKGVSISFIKPSDIDFLNQLVSVYNINITQMPLNIADYF